MGRRVRDPRSLRRPSLVEYLTFARTLPPTAVMIIFWLGVAAFLGYGIYWMVELKATMTPETFAQSLRERRSALRARFPSAYGAFARSPGLSRHPGELPRVERLALGVGAGVALAAISYIPRPCVAARTIRFGL